MNYFPQNYTGFRWPLAEGRTPGFRLPQWGALHAIGAHSGEGRTCNRRDANRVWQNGGSNGVGFHLASKSRLGCRS